MSTDEHERDQGVEVARQCRRFVKRLRLTRTTTESIKLSAAPHHAVPGSATHNQRDAVKMKQERRTRRRTHGHLLWKSRGRRHPRVDYSGASCRLEMYAILSDSNSVSNGNNILQSDVHLTPGHQKGSIGTSKRLTFVRRDGDVTGTNDFSIAAQKSHQQKHHRSVSKTETGRFLDLGHSREWLHTYLECPCVLDR